jgi:hypothetical protein
METFLEYITKKPTWMYRSIEGDEIEFRELQRDGLKPNWKFKPNDTVHLDIDPNKIYLYMATSIEEAEKYGHSSNSIIVRFRTPMDAQLVNGGYYVTTLPIPPTNLQIKLDINWDTKPHWANIMTTSFGANGIQKGLK